MRKGFWIGLAVLATVVALSAREIKAEISACGPCDMAGCRTKASKWNWGGHLETGFYANQYGQKNAYGGETLWPNDSGPDEFSGNTFLLQNTHQTDFQMNQLYFYLERELDTRRGWDVGGRVDFAFGTDARFVQASGLEKDAGHGYWGSGDYYSALAQIYGEIGYRDLSVKIGKFYDPMGVEGFASNERFFYSWSYAYGVTPDTYTGVLANWQMTDKLSFYGGWVNGEAQFMDSARDNAFLGGLEYQWTKRVKLAYGVMMGQDNRWDEVPANIISGEIDTKRKYFLQSLAVYFQPNERWDYAFEWTLRNEKQYSDIYGGGIQTGHAKAYDGVYGINQELVYRFNRKWSIGGRFEWMRTFGGINTFNGTDIDDMDVYSLTVALNWKPRPWLTVRPEVRYDKVFGGNDPFDNYKGDGRNEQFMGGGSVIVEF